MSERQPAEKPRSGADTPSSLVFYNDNDAFCAQWLRNLGDAGLLPIGFVDERSILDIEPSDLAGYEQCHFFAGIGGWPYALRLAGYEGSVWTGSCPCQPFSSAGKQGGSDDERHLWPCWFRLIQECRPDTILGEQIAGSVGFGWIDRVFADLEAEGYACGASILGAHSVGAAHVRQRLFWVANASSAKLQRFKSEWSLPRKLEAPHIDAGRPLADARRGLAANHIDLLLGDGLPIGVERSATKAYGNSLVPQVAVEFIKAFMEC
jgi:DNA (cytosine-5)-methyltransferase 1